MPDEAMTLLFASFVCSMKTLTDACAESGDEPDSVILSSEFDALFKRFGLSPQPARGEDDRRSLNFWGTFNGLELYTRM